MIPTCIEDELTRGHRTCIEGAYAKQRGYRAENRVRTTRKVHGMLRENRVGQMRSPGDAARKRAWTNIGKSRRRYYDIEIGGSHREQRNYRRQLVYRELIKIL
ncbi:hypothetical protein NPIL_703231 [Nephila pilipes]|uniref:Uncharacterized protein n=1 Tax=Nephila pilipes TaxID=299642 RepID=A0A8X6PNY2_NEPPI|nr:hypothetical protein NPIL_703231 [Nephila pilipes]